MPMLIGGFQCDLVPDSTPPSPAFCQFRLRWWIPPVGAVAVAASQGAVAMGHRRAQRNQGTAGELLLSGSDTGGGGDGDYEREAETAV